MKKKQEFRIFFLSIFLVTVLVVVGVGYWRYVREGVVPVVPVPVVEPVARWWSKLDGSVVATEDMQLPLVLGVMIDNHVDARPQQVGLSKARVVYEALAEGGITRYLALFNAADSVAKVGPVRSARPYYLNWIREYGDSTYWHSGGSPEALKMIASLRLPSTNEFSHGQYYWRDRAYDAPHNLFTSSSLWNALLTRREATPDTTWSGWKFMSSTAASNGIPVKGVVVTYSPDYKVGWVFNGKHYERQINGKPHNDGAEQIMADTVIIQEVKMRILDEVGRKELSSIGSGVVRVFSRGQMVRGTWKKISATDRTIFLDEAGVEIPLAPGQIWVQVTPVSPTVEITS